MSPSAGEGQCRVRAPGKDMSEAEAASIFGYVTWLWLRCPLHCKWPVWLLNEHVLPGIRAGSFALFEDGHRPLGFLSWASLSPEAERRYLKNPNSLSQEDWSSGDRVWIVDCVAPFGHFPSMYRYIRGHFRQTHIVVRALRLHAGEETAKVVEYFNPDSPEVLRRHNRKDFLQNYEAAFGPRDDLVESGMLRFS